MIRRIAQLARLKRERELASAVLGGTRLQRSAAIAPRSLLDSIGADNLSFFNYLAAWQPLGSRSMRRSG